ncbi:MAG: hypothetical protein PHY92_05325 [Alphaproteobacteria bacterium]|nr:hypothetical protein [Alphaproteobacteria bacterium]
MKNLTGPAPLNNIKYALLDLDGTFGEITPQFSEHCLDVLADTVLRLGAPLTKEEALAEARLSHKKCSSCFCVFWHKYGISIEAFNDIYHEGIDFSLNGPCDVTRGQLLASPVPLAVLSHSSEPWINKSLKAWGLEGVIPQNRIISIEKVGFNLKITEKAYLKALALLGWPPELTCMVEDTAENLVSARKVLGATALLTHGRIVNPARYPNMGSYVDVTVNTLSDFLALAGTVAANAPAEPISSLRLSTSNRGCLPAVR